MKPGQPERRVDFEYKRGGNAYVHMAFEPLKGFREVEITERRRGVEFAHLMEHLVDDLYPQAEKIRVVLDNLSTHTGAAFYEAFPAEKARTLATKIEFIYTPVHGSWLNMAEIELSVLGRQCLERFPEQLTAGCADIDPHTPCMHKIGRADFSAEPSVRIMRYGAVTLKSAVS